MDFIWDGKSQYESVGMDQESNMLITIANELAANVMQCKDIAAERQITEVMLTQFIMYIEKDKKNFEPVSGYLNGHRRLIEESHKILKELQRGQGGFSFDAFMMIKKGIGNFK